MTGIKCELQFAMNGNFLFYFERKNLTCHLHWNYPTVCCSIVNNQSSFFRNVFLSNLRKTSLTEVLRLASAFGGKLSRNALN
jgi:hypothetical protein